MIPLATLTRQQCLGADQVRSVAVMLGLSAANSVAGGTVPAGWHFPLIACETPRSDLRADGFPGLGIPLPYIDLPRLVAGGRKVRFERRLECAAPLVRTSVITALRHKQGAAGRLAVLTVEHVIGEEGGMQHAPAIREEQTYLFLSTPYAETSQPDWHPPSAAKVVKTVTPDATMLFQFSALSFNTHRIHLDRDYARDVEGYPALVVNGGLTTLLMTEIARCELGLDLASFILTNHAPLFCDRPITFMSEQTGAAWRILALDDRGGLAAEMEITAHGY